MKLEIIKRQPERETCRTPVLFVHGAWHAAWCWDEFFLPYFAAQGFTAYALSLRNHGHSEARGHLRWKRGAHFVADVAQVVRELGIAPVLVGHSMGGYVVQKYLERHRVPAAVLLASVPPSGALGASLRTFRRQPLAFLKANLQLRLGPLVETPELAYDAFCSKSTPVEHAAPFLAKMQDETYLGYLDMLALDLPRPKRVRGVPMLVLGAADDAIFSQREVRATARAYGAEVEIFPRMGHDMMLEPGWRAVADRIIDWLRGVPGVCAEK